MRAPSTLGPSTQGTLDRGDPPPRVKTDGGAFEALFLPKPETFNALEIVEQEETGGFIYSFRGRPH